jgi:integrase
MSVFKRNKKYWISFWFKRQRYRLASPENTLAGARAYEAMYRQKLLNGEDIETEKEEKIIVPKFKDFAQDWLKTYVGNNNSFAENQHKAGCLRIYLVPFFGKYPLNKINNLLIEKFKIRMSKTELAPATINHHLSTLSVCLKTAVEWEIIENSPRIKKIKVPPRPIVYLKEEEVERLLSKAQGQIREMIYFALKTGVRFGELIALDWQDINFSEKRITIRRSIVRGIMGSPKNNKIRYIPLIDSVSDMLIKRYQKTGFVFSRHNTHFTQHYSCKKLYQACREAGLPKIGWHKLRHSFASHLAQNSVSIQVIKELLGHADIKTTMQYAHLSPSILIGAINTLEPKNKKIINFGHNLDTNSLLSDKEETDLLLATCNNSAKDKQKQTFWSISVL